ncbi:MAG: YkgJ family cysteine cluster protein [Myxococcaceae bacterium]|nr:YkgJ family cysteine cluster protein [Myxococcaceae bacterium]
MSESIEGLCRSCGLCCDGSLFDVVAVSAAEARVLEAHAVPVERAEGRFKLRQPCAGLQGTVCGCYAVRPEGCRRFVCLLAHARAAGEVSEAQAVALVAEARARLGRGESNASDFFRRYFSGR